MSLENVTHARKSSLRLRISQEKYSRIFGDPTHERGKETYVLSADLRRQKQLIEEARLLRDRWEKCFGPPPEIRRGVYRRTIDGDWKHWDDFTKDEVSAYLAAQRTKSTRISYISDIEPFMTGRLPTSTLIGGRHEKREYMKRNELVEFEEIPEQSTDYQPDESQIRMDLERVFQMDRAEIMSKERAYQEAELDGTTDAADDPLAGILER